MKVFQGANVLVTGGTGSFGKAFTRLLLEQYGPNKVAVFSRDELKQHEMQKLPQYQDPRMRFFIGDVRDRLRLQRALTGIDIVVHAAALKQVPACEYNPLEAVQTNIHGAEHIIDAALDNGVERVIALSTDKAVNPANLYGATKLVMEKLLIQANSYGGAEGTRFSCVRYGNVVGSRGSVVPLFLEQRQTGKVTVTDDRMTRFWMTLEEGTKFVASSAERMKGGEVFVPKIPSMKVPDLVAAIAPGCKVEHIGIRPGEKLHEVLIGVDEARHTLDAGDRFVVQPLHTWWDESRRPEGKPLPDGFHYASNNNTQWLTVADLRRLVEDSANLHG